MLCVKGLSPLVQDDQVSVLLSTLSQLISQQVTELFRKFAMVKSVHVIRDPITGYSRGIGFVEFHSEDQAAYVIHNSAMLKLDKNVLKVSFARLSFMQAQLDAQVFSVWNLPHTL